MSGYRFLLNVCSNSCNCCDVKCVRWRRCRLFFLSFFVSSLATICSSCITKFVFSTLTFVSFIDRLPAIFIQRTKSREKISSDDPGWMLMSGGGFTFILSISILISDIGWWLKMQLSDVQTVCDACHRCVAVVTEITSFGPYCNRFKNWKKNIVNKLRCKKDNSKKIVRFKCQLRINVY